MEQPSGTENANADGWIEFLLTDPSVLGAVTWTAGLLTFAGIMVALWQLSKVKTAAKAAAAAATSLSREVRSRELMFVITEAMAHLENVRTYCTRGSGEAAILVLDLARRDILSCRELLLDNPSEKRRLSRMLVTLADIYENLEQTIRVEGDISEIGFHVKAVRDDLQQSAVKIRHSYNMET